MYVKYKRGSCGTTVDLGGIFSHGTEDIGNANLKLGPYHSRMICVVS